MNKVTESIARFQAKLDNLEPEKIESLDSSNQWDSEEVRSLQNLKSAATGGLLTLDEAQTIFTLLGGDTDNPKHINSAPLAARMVLTMIHHELLSRQIQGR